MVVYDIKNRITDENMVLECCEVLEGGVIDLKAGGKISIYISKEELKSGCKWLKYAQYYTNTKNTCGIVNKVKVRYEGESSIDRYLVLLNEDGVEDGVCINIAELELQGRNISSIEIVITNRGSDSIKINGLELNTSKDVDVNQLTDALEVDVISADNAMLLSAWIDNLQVNQLETNIVSKSVFEGFLLKRDFIKINDREIDFGTEDLSDKEVEHLEIEVAGEKRGVYYTAIGEHKDAYKYLTINHPSTYRPEMSPSECEKFRYMVRRTLSKGSGLRLHFIDEQEGDKVVSNPVIDFGVEGGGGNRSGCGRIIRGREGLRISYVDLNNKEHFIEFNNDLGFIVNGGNKLECLEIGESYFRADYSHYSVSFKLEKDEGGRIISLTDDKGFVVPILYNKK